MIALLGTTVTASFLDSLNPSAIAQQMLLQAMVKRKRDVWFFIAGIALANFLMGVAVYYGVAAQLSRLWAYIALQYPSVLHGAELAAGIFGLVWGIKMLVASRRQAIPGAEATVQKAGKSMTPAALFWMGVGFCAVELSSALPYFGFLAVLSGYQLSVLPVLGLIFLYCMIYASPLMLLYAGYNRLQGTAVIKRIEQILGRVSAYVLPVAFCLLGLALLLDGGYGLLIAHI